MDLIFFGGQSNMEGQTEGVPLDTAPVDGALEYRYKTREFVPLKHPVGEDIPPLCPANYGFGSLLPDFCRTYVRYSGNKVAAVHAARGATNIDEWQPDTELYQKAVEKQRAAITDLGEMPEHIYYVWLQGESDAIRKLSGDEYLEKLTILKNALKRDCDIDKFAIIRVGYFAGDEADEVIMHAQERAAEIDPDFIILTRITAALTKNSDYINPEAAGHYNNRAMLLLGTDAAYTLATVDDGDAPRHKSGLV